MNRKLLTKTMAVMLAALALSPAASQAQSVNTDGDHNAGQVMGTWINPRGTVKVQTGDCGTNLCGRVVWAAPAAEADARGSGVGQLIGTELLRDYRAAGTGHYQGTVYVPDMGRTFYSTIDQRDPNDIRISGCILGGLLCKSQDWHRV
ncbi:MULTISPECIES: DUF2147 domain-containing protein [unclassified Novosphingobium]|uniref:DUF2147 domain-containing protein n=1 Tax=unclassified Novosphingobium TaxID=2644732 RepID=UPI0013591673|nr:MULTISPECIES: DUF2147 domain-containing protein [unclassified Novosphingobium]